MNTEYDDLRKEFMAAKITELDNQQVTPGFAPGD